MFRLSAAEQTEINLSVGAVVVGNYLSYLTMGIVLCATWTYFSKFPNDKWWFKVLVTLCVSMCIGDTIATGQNRHSTDPSFKPTDIFALAGCWSYDWAVTNYANPAALAFIHWGVPAEGFLLGTCGLSVQLFYAWRDVSPYRAGVRESCPIFISQTPVTLIFLNPYRYGLLDVAHFSNTQAGLGSQPHPTRALGMVVECNLLSLLVQAMAIALFDSSIKVYYPITNMMIAKVYTFSLLVSLNCRHSENGPETSNGEHSSSSSRGEGGIVELTVLHTSSFPSTRVSHIQQEITRDWQERLAYDDEFDTSVVLSPA
ncbi:hypothetical protein BT96DRAFT_1008792 [Gymnopus androsaceus JB14]|uniref:Uncharacterized protein n=1 Tax=Gymnopus androsaceus JB14 TaxID=1447944 RepID=A0A6A4GEK3_9AGAR|nr:hypothetical protein BT96DRAFT_1008792 [Gymnopus androsaceus JB14]